MNKFTTSLMVLLFGVGLAACDQQDSGPQTPAEEQTSPSPASPEVTPEGNRPDAVPAEPIVPEDRNPAEQPDAGTHGIQDGALVPGDGPQEESGAVPEAEREGPTTPLEEQSTTPSQP